MPAIGLGTGGYGASKNAYGAYPECWMEIAGCGNYTIAAVSSWLQLGGRRLDAADSYDTQFSVGQAMARSAVPRSEIFVLQKTGNWNPMGYNDVGFGAPPVAHPSPRPLPKKSARPPRPQTRTLTPNPNPTQHYRPFRSLISS